MLANSVNAIFWWFEISPWSLFLIVNHMGRKCFRISKILQILGIKFEIDNVRRLICVTIRCNKIRSGLIKKSFNKSSKYLLILHLYSFKT